jgi:SAM-dependent methyltransferase
MSFYSDHVVPRLVDGACGNKRNDDTRRRVCAGLEGDVIEIGFGSGRNVPFYPPAVRSVDAVEPADVGWRLARRRLAGSATPVRRVGLDGQSLPLPSASYDTALSTWTLCTIPDPAQALAEVRRVLKPGGRLRFVEHGLAPDAGVQRWQRRLEPVQTRVAGGCHLTRPIAELLATTGFELSDLDVYYDEHAPRVLGALTLGTAVSW